MGRDRNERSEGGREALAGRPPKSSRSDALERARGSVWARRAAECWKQQAGRTVTKERQLAEKSAWCGLTLGHCMDFMQVQGVRWSKGVFRADFGGRAASWHWRVAALNILFGGCSSLACAFPNPAGPARQEGCCSRSVLPMLPREKHHEHRDLREARGVRQRRDQRARATTSSSATGQRLARALLVLGGDNHEPPPPAAVSPLSSCLSSPSALCAVGGCPSAEWTG